MGLPGSGKTTLAKKIVDNFGDIAWFNADQVRKMSNDWDFSISGRNRQAKRMTNYANFEINRKEIQMSIFSSYVKNDTISNNPLDYSSLDYKVPYTRAQGMLDTYLIEFFKVKHNNS